MSAQVCSPLLQGSDLYDGICLQYSLALPVSVESSFWLCPVQRSDTQPSIQHPGNENFLCLCPNIKRQYIPLTISQCSQQRLSISGRNLPRFITWRTPSFLGDCAEGFLNCVVSEKCRWTEPPPRGYAGKSFGHCHKQEGRVSEQWTVCISAPQYSLYGYMSRHFQHTLWTLPFQICPTTWTKQYKDVKSLGQIKSMMHLAMRWHAPCFIQCVETQFVPQGTRVRISWVRQEVSNLPTNPVIP